MADDGSSDQTWNLVQKYAKNIRGRYVTFLYSDDMLRLGAMDYLLDLAFANDADIVEGSFELFDDNGTIRKIVHEDTIDEDARHLQGFACGKIYKGEFFRKV